MTIRKDIKDALADGPKTIEELSTITKHRADRIYNGAHYMLSMGHVRKVGDAFALPLEKAPPQQVNRLTLPAYVPPKTLHRPTFHAPGCRIVEKLTGRELV